MKAKFIELRALKNEKGRARGSEIVERQLSLMLRLLNVRLQKKFKTGTVICFTIYNFILCMIELILINLASINKIFAKNIFLIFYPLVILLELQSNKLLFVIVFFFLIILR